MAYFPELKGGSSTHYWPECLNRKNIFKAAAAAFFIYATL
jgi:hypothetical protein